MLSILPLQGLFAVVLDWDKHIPHEVSVDG